MAGLTTKAWSSQDGGRVAPSARLLLIPQSGQDDAPSGRTGLLTKIPAREDAPM
jgi:hypothetical protein